MRSMICHSREQLLSSLLCSPFALCFTSLCQTLCIALGDVGLGCSYLTIETHSLKLSTHCSSANLKATWSFEVCSDLLCRKLATSAHYAAGTASTYPALGFFMAYHFMAELQWFSITSTFILPITVDCGIFSKRGNFTTGHVGQVASYYGTTLIGSGFEQVSEYILQYYKNYLLC